MEEQSIEFIYPTCNDLLSVVVTNNREAAADRIEKGYLPFTVPQMFGAENGSIVLFLEKGATEKSDGMIILRDYEEGARIHLKRGDLKCAL